MKDYTCNGVPVAQLSTSYIQDLLIDGVVINDDDGDPHAEQHVIERLKLELEIRRL